MEEGKICNNDDNGDSAIDPDIDEKLQDVLGHLSKDFQGEISAQNLGPMFGEYGSLLHAYQRSDHQENMLSSSNASLSAMPAVASGIDLEKPDVSVLANHGEEFTTKSDQTILEAIDSSKESPTATSILKIMTSPALSKSLLLSPLSDHTMQLMEKPKGNSSSVVSGFDEKKQKLPKKVSSQNKDTCNSRGITLKKELVCNTLKKEQGSKGVSNATSHNGSKRVPNMKVLQKSTKITSLNRMISHSLSVDEFKYQHSDKPRSLIGERYGKENKKKTQVDTVKPKVNHKRDNDMDDQRPAKRTKAEDGVLKTSKNSEKCGKQNGNHTSGMRSLTSYVHKGRDIDASIQAVVEKKPHLDGVSLKCHTGSKVAATVGKKKQGLEMKPKRRDIDASIQTVDEKKPHLDAVSLKCHTGSKVAATVGKKKQGIEMKPKIKRKRENDMDGARPSKRTKAENVLPGNGNSDDQEIAASTDPAVANAIKEAYDLKSVADRLKTCGSTESTQLYFHAALNFLLAASLLESCDSEMSRSKQMYSSSATLCELCAQEYEKGKEMAAAALAYKCMEVAYLRVIYNSHPIANKDGNELQMALQNRSYFIQLKRFVQDVDSAMEASRKSQIMLGEAQDREGLSCVRNAINFSFQDVDELLRLVRVAMDAINH